MTEILLDLILHSQNIEYGVFDANMRLARYTPGLPAYLDPVHTSLQDAYITDIFQELIGYENSLTEILHNKKTPLRLDYIQNQYLNTDTIPWLFPEEQPSYHTIQVHPYQDGLLVIVRNVTEDSILEQQLVQRRNELDILAEKLIEDLKQANLELTLAYENTLEGWAKALELRDKETEGHSTRVKEMTVRLARAMGIDDSEMVQIHRGALLHDIGKMGIPDYILLKPGSLSSDEWKIMRMHPELAARMLRDIVYLKPTLDIPYYHHEKWDGTGYPKGLQGEEIPLPARIFAIVDVWDALRSDRPYRPAWSERDIIEYIHQETGKHFDPNVVEIFLSLIVIGNKSI